MTAAKPSPGIVYVALCRCGNLVGASRKRDQVEGIRTCLACPPGDGWIRIETYRHAPKKERGGRKPRKAWKR